MQKVTQVSIDLQKQALPNIPPLTLVFQQEFQDGLDGAQQSSDYCFSCLASSSGGMENKIAVWTSDLYTAKDSPSIPILHPSKRSALPGTIFLVSAQCLACLGKDAYTKDDYHAVSMKRENQTLGVTSCPPETVDQTLNTRFVEQFYLKLSGKTKKYLFIFYFLVVGYFDYTLDTHSRDSQ